MSKKSFVLYYDSLGMLETMTDKQAGILFKAIAKLDKEPDFELDGLMNAIFHQFKTQIKRDKEKYSVICEKRKKAGAKGGLSKAKQMLASAKQEEPKPSKAKQSEHDSDTVNENENENETVNDSDKKVKRFTEAEALEIYSHYPVKKGRATGLAKLQKTIKTDLLTVEFIISKIKEYQRELKDMSYCKHFSSWINQKGWDDEYNNKPTEQPKEGKPNYHVYKENRKAAF